MSRPEDKSGGQILVVDDEEHVRRVLEVMLRRQGHRVTLAENGTQALEKFSTEVFDLVILDLRMPDLDGIEVLRRLRRQSSQQTVVMITAYASVETALAAMKEGAFDYIGKPFNEDEILLVVHKALERTRMLAENQRLLGEVKSRHGFEEIIGRSEAMAPVMATLAKVAATRASVLITGESGTGKELVARALHYNSPRGERPLVAVNCAAIPINLMESELFGHLKGAFTGAERSKKGLFEEADGSSLFLDEVGELPLEVQAKLLRALQEGEIKRVGDNSTRQVDIRVIAASNKDLAAEVEAGRFREDLFYRLNVIPLRLPPLRERQEDIPLLAQHFLEQAADRHGLGAKRLTPQAAAALAQAPWKGNVRELANLVEQAYLMSEGDEIRPSDLPAEIGAAPEGVRVEVPAEEEDLKKVLKQVAGMAEKQVISRVLQRTGGNRTQAARRLGISRRALITKIQQMAL